MLTAINIEIRSQKFVIFPTLKEILSRVSAHEVNFVFIHIQITDFADNSCLSRKSRRNRW